MTCPELRITDAEVAEPRWYRCGRCGGSGATGTVPGSILMCERCVGYGFVRVRNLSPGASARIGAILVARLPHLRHAVWPPKRATKGEARAALAMALGMIGAVQ